MVSFDNPSNPCSLSIRTQLLQILPSGFVTRNNKPLISALTSVELITEDDPLPFGVSL